jgi:hypothetical protein
MRSAASLEISMCVYACGREAVGAFNAAALRRREGETGYHVFLPRKMGDLRSTPIAPCILTFYETVRFRQICDS